MNLKNVDTKVAINFITISKDLIKYLSLPTDEKMQNIVEIQSNYYRITFISESTNRRVTIMNNPRTLIKNEIRGCSKGYKVSGSKCVKV